MNPIEILFRLLLSASSTILLLSIYWINSKIYIELLGKNLSTGLYLLLPVLLTVLVLFFSKFLTKDDFQEGDTTEVENVNHQFLPSYLGYFFVSSSISNNTEVISTVYTILFLFTFISQSFYFNPIFMLFGYSFYQVKLKNGMKVILISKQKFKVAKDVKIPVAYKVNSFTFIDGGN